MIQFGFTFLHVTGSLPQVLDFLSQILEQLLLLYDFLPCVDLLHLFVVHLAVQDCQLTLHLGLPTHVLLENGLQTSFNIRAHFLIDGVADLLDCLARVAPDVDLVLLEFKHLFLHLAHLIAHCHDGLAGGCFLHLGALN